MPIIEGVSSIRGLAPAVRSAMLPRLAQEFRGQSTEDGPVIFRIPLARSDRFDTLVIWSEFRDVGVHDRQQLIRDAAPSDMRLGGSAMVYGVTPLEAIEDGLLPYEVVPLIRDGEADLDDLKRAMRAQGAIVFQPGLVNLRLPTKAMAEEARRRLSESHPQGQWSIEFAGSRIS